MARAETPKPVKGWAPINDDEDNKWAARVNEYQAFTPKSSKRVSQFRPAGSERPSSPSTAGGRASPATILKRNKRASSASSDRNATARKKAKAAAAAVAHPSPTPSKTRGRPPASQAQRTPKVGTGDANGTRKETTTNAFKLTLSNTAVGPTEGLDPAAVDKSYEDGPRRKVRVTNKPSNNEARSPAGKATAGAKAQAIVDKFAAAPPTAAQGDGGNMADQLRVAAAGLGGAVGGENGTAGVSGVGEGQEGWMTIQTKDGPLGTFYFSGLRFVPAAKEDGA